MKRKPFLIGFTLALVVLLTIAASIDYRALDSTQFSTSGTVSIINGATETNITLRGTTTVSTNLIVLGSEAVTNNLTVGNGAKITNYFAVYGPKSGYQTSIEFTNRTKYLQGAPYSNQTNDLSLFVVVGATQQLTSIGFLDGSRTSSGVQGRFMGMNYFPYHIGTEPELTIDAPGSIAIGWAQDTVKGTAIGLNRSWQWGIGDGHLPDIFMHSEPTSSQVNMTNLGYSIPLIRGSPWTSNGVYEYNNMTEWAHTTATNETRLSWYGNWRQTLSLDNKDYDFDNAGLMFELVRAGTNNTANVYGGLNIISNNAANSGTFKVGGGPTSIASSNVVEVIGANGGLAFNVGQDGKTYVKSNLSLAMGTEASPSLNVGDLDSGLYNRAGSRLTMTQDGVNVFEIASGLFSFASSVSLSWSAGILGATADSVFARSGVGTFILSTNLTTRGSGTFTNGVISKAQYNSTAASAFNWTSNNLYAGKITCNASTVYLTNAAVTANAVVLATINTADLTASTIRAVPTAGLITFSFLAAPTGNVDISWKIESP